MDGGKFCRTQNDARLMNSMKVFPVKNWRSFLARLSSELALEYARDRSRRFLGFVDFDGYAIVRIHVLARIRTYARTRTRAHVAAVMAKT